MSKVVLRGHEAVDYAAEHGLSLNRTGDEREGARQGVGVEEARRLVEQDPASIWLEIDTTVNPADSAE